MTAPNNRDVRNMVGYGLPAGVRQSDLDDQGTPPKCPDFWDWWNDAPLEKAEAIIKDFVDEVCVGQRSQLSKLFHSELQSFFARKFERAGGVL